MAKNYSLKEAVEIINAGTDLESIADIGRRYPILLHKVTKVCTQAGQDFVDLMSFMPEHLTANKVNTAIKNAFAEDSTEAEDENTDNTEAEDEPKPKKAKKVKSSDSENEYESMSGKELWELLGQAGKRKDCKEKMGGVKRDQMLEYINKYGLEGTTSEDDSDADEATDEVNPYEGKSAMELFKECKKRGIKAEPKKKAKYYADLLIKADAEATEESEEDDDWGDEVEEPKTEKKADKKTAKKPAKAEEKEDDDDDEWDI